MPQKQRDNNVREDGNPFLFTAEDVASDPCPEGCEQCKDDLAHLAHLDVLDTLAAPTTGDPWPETDEELAYHVLARLGLAAPKDLGAYVQRRRDEQAAGLPYYAPSDREIAEAAKWDAVYRARAARGELTGTFLDDHILADREAARLAAREAERRAMRGWPNLKAALKYWPTAFLLWVCFAYLLTAVVLGTLEVIGK